MQTQHQHTETLFKKICSLPPEKMAVVEDFVEFLGSRNEAAPLARAASKLSEKSFQKVWDNVEDGEYDNL